MDNDGDLDIVTGQPWSNNVSSISIRTYYNTGSGLFGAAQVVESGKGLYSGVVYDIDGDGDLDIAGQNRYAGTSKPYVYENLLDTIISPPPTRPTQPLGEFKLSPVIMLLFDE